VIRAAGSWTGDSALKTELRRRVHPTRVVAYDEDRARPRHTLGRGGQEVRPGGRDQWPAASDQSSNARLPPLWPGVLRRPSGAHRGQMAARCDDAQNPASVRVDVQVGTSRQPGPGRPRDAGLEDHRHETTRTADSTDPRGDPEMRPQNTASGGRVADRPLPPMSRGGGIVCRLPLLASTAEILLRGEQPVGLTARPQRKRPRTWRLADARAAEARRGEGADLRPRSRGRGSPKARACNRASALPGDAPMSV